MPTAVKYIVAFFSLAALIISMLWFDSKNQPQTVDTALTEYHITADKLTNRTLLEEFNRRVNLSTPSFMVLPQAGESNIVLRYTLTTHSSKPIHSIEWLALYLYQGHIIFNKEIQVAFKSDSGNLNERNIDLVFPIESISSNVRELFLRKDSNIRAVTLPQTIQYADGSRLELSYN
ncbi:hypothetical protein KRX11_01795 [Pasteurellaceae bacterium TAE3-ERU1]|uniref:hypothetical protein n=1 Tax=Spirabiliibacterium mucosae TaxID=28156 RepID=UPI001AAC5B7D|nr:hypothetical protein [Spirabiliibacterium mucosae]MBE2898149.1 hypothetical protein [Spirabiliibacterium mucosae]MBV7387380.1 hypothetical protein [Pasteurellaceae bacterium TAE3-ERU1]